MKEKRLHTDPDEVRCELQKVADELALPLNDCRVCYEWSQRGNCWNKRVSDEIMANCIFLLVTKTIIVFFVTFPFVFHSFFLIGDNYLIRR